MAGIMDRLSRLIRANVNDLIDQAEDPEKMIDQLLREMQARRKEVLVTSVLLMSVCGADIVEGRQRK